MVDEAPPPKKRGRPLGFRPKKKESLPLPVTASSESLSAKAVAAVVNSEELVDFRDRFADRRRTILGYKLRGWTLRQIAKEMGLSAATVLKDLREIQRLAREKVKITQQQELLGDCVSCFERVEQEAWEQYNLSLDQDLKVKFLGTVQQARNNQLKLLTELGIVGANKPKPAPTHQTVNINNLTPQAQDILAMALITAGMQQQAPATTATAKVIDVEPEKKNEIEHPIPEGSSSTSGKN